MIANNVSEKVKEFFNAPSNEIDRQVDLYMEMMQRIDYLLPSKKLTLEALALKVFSDPERAEAFQYEVINLTLMEIAKIETILGETIISVRKNDSRKALKKDSPKSLSPKLLAAPNSRNRKAGVSDKAKFNIISQESTHKTAKVKPKQTNL